MTVTFFSDMTATRTDLPKIKTDELIPDSGIGADLFDISHPFSLRTNTVANGTPVYNLNGDNTYSSLLVPATTTASLSDGGIQFGTASAANYAGVVVTGKPLADIFTDQQFIICGYIKLPTEAEWASGNNRIFGDSANVTFGAVSIIVTKTGDGSPQLTGHRLIGAGGAIDTQKNIQLPTSCYGKKAQVAIYRTETEWVFTVIFEGGARLTSTSAAGVLCTYDWSARELLLGQCGITLTNKVYRGFVENLKVTQRNPVTVLSEDWLRFIN